MSDLTKKTMGLEPLLIKSNGLPKTCPRHGEYEGRVVVIQGEQIPFSRGCPRCAEELAVKARMEEQKRKISRLMTESGIPPRFRKCTIEGLIGDSKDIDHARNVAKGYIGGFEKHLSRGTSLYFCGKPGTGKTHLACAIGRELMRIGYSVRYISEYKLTRAIKLTWGQDAERSEDEVTREFIQPDLLIIDEIGVSFSSDADGILFYQVLGGRYECSRPTILVGNLTQEEMVKHFHERVADRMRDNGGATISFNWQSHRR